MIRDIPEDALAALGARLGMSHSEYIWRRLTQDAPVTGLPVSVHDLRGFAAAFADLADPSVMGGAWD